MKIRITPEQAATLRALLARLHDCPSALADHTRRESALSAAMRIHGLLLQYDHLLDDCTDLLRAMLRAMEEDDE